MPRVPRLAVACSGDVSILTPPRGGVPRATCTIRLSRVSILTPPRGGVPRIATSSVAVDAMFQSSLPPEGECHRGYRWSITRRRCARVSILTPPRGRVQQPFGAVLQAHVDVGVSILTPPEGECHDRDHRLRHMTQVSILTPPRGRVQHVLATCRERVSILTPPRGRVPPCSRSDSVATIRFNPHSPPRGSATIYGSTVDSRDSLFQSSLPPEGECHVDRICDRRSERFNPHSPPRGSATASDRRVPRRKTFQSSLPPEGECHTCSARPSRSVADMFQSSLPPEGECHVEY